MTSIHLGLSFAIAAALLAACGSPDVGDEGQQCGPNGVCNTGLTCDTSRSVCVRTASATDAAVPDAAPPDAVLPDAAPPDAPTSCNQLSNGGFELPAINANSDFYSTSPSFLPGWILSAGPNNFFIENGRPFGGSRVAEGNQSICLNSDGAPNVYIEQSFDTTVGQSYTVSFFLTDEQVAGPTITAVRVDVAGVSMTFDRTHDTGYVKKTLTFVAAASATTLRISDASPGSIAGSSPLIDAISVCPN